MCTFELYQYVCTTLDEQVQVRETTSLFLGPVLKQSLDELMENQIGYELGGCFGGIELGERDKQELNELSSRGGISSRTTHHWTA